LRNRAAKTKAKSCVLSPISASATMPVEIKKASNIHPKMTRRPTQPVPIQMIDDRGDSAQFK
jgi:hypothetical protein